MEKYRKAMLDGWRFCLTSDANAVCRGYDDGAWRVLDLPHDWQIEQPRHPDAVDHQGFFPREHVGVYRLHFTPEEGWRGMQVRVLFDGVQRFSAVFLNDTPVGGRPYGYVPFLCDLTAALRFGEDNVLAVRVDNTDLSDGKWTARGGDRWYSGAGIYRNVWLLVQPRTHIAHDGIRVCAEPVNHGPNGDMPDVAGIRCDRARVSVRVNVENPHPGVSLQTAIYDCEGNQVYASETDAAEENAWELALQKPLLWTLEKPALYRAEFILRDQSGVLDEHTVRFGVRTAVFDEEDGFVLNGQKVKMWGVNLHHDGGMVGAAVPVEIWKRRLKTLKSLGVNTIRASHNPMAEELYDLCDEMGFLVVDELYDKWNGSTMYYDAFFEEWHEKDLTAMIERDANHPSIVLWSVGNEVRGQYSEQYFSNLKTLCDLTRRLDPTRAVTAVLIMFVLPEYNDTTPLGKRLAVARRYAEIVDVFSCNYMEHYYEKLRESGMRKPILGAEVRMYYRHDDRFQDSVTVSLTSPYEIAKKHDWVCGSLVWAGIDYLGEAPFWPVRGWTGNLLDSTGDIKTRAWYCAAQWKKEPVLKLAVYDETEPWDGCRGMWGFPQMRRHWKYNQFEKVLHVAVMTNCDTVKLYQNSQTVRTAYLSDSRDGMIHFYLPYIPGQLRAEGWRNGMPVAEDTLYSDHMPQNLTAEADRTALPADGHSVALVDVTLTDGHGIRYELEDRLLSWRIEGVPCQVRLDNGNACSTQPFDASKMPLHNGHLLLMLRAGHEAGKVLLQLRVEGFEEKEIAFDLE
ncbi:MAG: DUF4982 domain-containing protein [Clostridia bacterium]|nr:DUF4982 domain-containing protein [Clostridia bacterium]